MPAAESIQPLVANRFRTATVAQAAQALNDDNWVVQQKFDGRRILISKDERGSSSILNKKGRRASNTAPIVERLNADAVNALPPNTVIDGEWASNRYYIFDCLAYNGDEVTVDSPYSERLGATEEIASRMSEHTNRVRVVRTTGGSPKERLDYVQFCVDHNAEGVILRDTTKPYQFGKYQDGAYKLRFKHRVDAVVHAIDHEKKTLDLEVYSFDQSAGEYKTYQVGSCGGQAFGFGQHNVGQVVEVEYSHLSENGKLINPVFIRRRDDKDASTCNAEQLKYERLKGEVPVIVEFEGAE